MGTVAPNFGYEGGGFQLNAGLEQLIVIASYGNSIIQSKKVMYELLDHRVFRFTKDISFNRIQEETINWGLAEWYNNLLEIKSKKLRLVYLNTFGSIPPQISLAFTNGGCWAIEVENQEGFELWKPIVEKVSIPESKKIWKIILTGQVKEQFSSIKNPSTTESLLNLLSCLENAKSFAEETGYEGWFNWFNKAISSVNSNNIGDVFDLLPGAIYSRDVQHLMYCAKESWVFGGMGSWNDLFFQEEALQRKYNDVTDKLFNAVTSSLITATNSPIKN